MNIAELFAKGGPVVWILAAYSAIGLAIVLERNILFLRLRRLPGEWMANLDRLLERPGNMSGLSRLIGPEARIIQAVAKAHEAGVRDLQGVGQRIRAQEIQRMEFGLRTLGILGNTAPLLGLLGTITGMIKAFMVIEQAGGKVDAQALAGGIWEAMLTTGVGLAVAIPILLLLHMLESTADKRAHGVRRHAMLLLERLPHREKPEQSEVVHHRKGVIHAV